MSRFAVPLGSNLRLSPLVLGLTVVGLGLAASLRAEPPELAPEPRGVYETPLAEPLTPTGPTGPTDPADKFKIDTDRLSFAAVEDDAPVRGEHENKLEHEAYNILLSHARQFTVAEQEKSANRDVVFLDLVKPIRKDFQYKLVRFEGRLKRLRRLEPTKTLAAEGVKDLYEAWMFPRNGADPMCVLITELPAGLEPAVEYNPPPNVTVAGYPFKLIRYESMGFDKKDPSKHEFRKAPLLMARSFTLEPQNPNDADGGILWREGFLPGMLGVMGGVAGVGLILTLWFRYGDKKVRTQLEGRRGRNPFAGAESLSDTTQPPPAAPL